MDSTNKPGPIIKTVILTAHLVVAPEISPAKTHMMILEKTQKIAATCKVAMVKLLRGVPTAGTEMEYNTPQVMRNAVK